MTIPPVVVFAVSAWLLTGTLMLATRDTVAFAKVFWGAVTIALWPLALVAPTLNRRRRARRVVIEDPTVLAATERATAAGVAAVTTSIDATLAAHDAGPSTLLLDPLAAAIEQDLSKAGSLATRNYLAATDAAGDDPVTLLALRTERAAFVEGFMSATDILNAALDVARRLDAEGERAGVPLVSDLRRHLAAIPGAAA